VNAKDIVILVCEKKSPAPHWTHTRGIYADLSEWPRSIDYYVKCPECGHVHGFYKSMAEARSKRLCPSCDFDHVEKLKKEVAKVDEAELPPEQPFDPDAPVNPKADLERYVMGDWVALAKWQLEQVLHERLDFDPDDFPNRDIDYEDPESFSKIKFKVEGSDEEYIIWKSEEDAEKDALDSVRNDLQDNPENFTQSWLENHLNVDKLRDFLKEDQLTWTREDFDEQHSDDEAKVRAMVEEGKLTEETFFKRNGELRKMTPALERLLEQAIDEWVTETVDSRLSDPLDYMREIYPEEEVMKQAIEWVGINVEEAAKDAVDTDGWQHFISRYDGKSIDLPCGAVAVRE
jgi:hypothetical protein